MRELKFAIRQLLKSPGFSATAVLMLGLGIGATTAIFSVVEGVLLRPLPFPDSARLVSLSDILKGADLSGNGEAGVTAPDIRNYIRDTHSFESLGGYGQTQYELSGVGEPAQVNAARMSAGVFQALKVQPLMGRFFTRQEDEQSQQVALLSYSCWQKRFHGDPTVLSAKFLLDRKPYIVIGVMPRGFEFPLVPGHLNVTELWVPFSATAEELSTGAASWNFAMVGRLKPGMTAAQAQSDAEVVAEATMRSYPAWMNSLRIRASIRPLKEETVQDARPLIRTLFLAVAVVLLIACANLASLLLVRAIRNRREVAIRLAVGARSGALLRQAVLESLLLSVAGGVLGLMAAALALRVGLGFLPETLPRADEIGLDWQVAGFALLLAVITGVICGLAPASAALRTNVNEALREGGRTGLAGSGHARLRSALVIAEIAVAMMLLTASGLLLRSFEKMRAVNPGFRADHTLTAVYSLPQKQYSTQAAVDEFNRELLRRLQELPQVKNVGTTSFLPSSGGNSNSAYVAENGAPAKNGGLTLATPMVVLGDYFRAMGIPLLRGRLFTDADTAKSELVVVVSRSFAQNTWPGEDPLGKRMRIGMKETQTPWLTVVGEVGDVKQGSPDGPDKAQFYQPVRQVEASIGALGSPTDVNGNYGYIALRTAVPPETMANALRAVVRVIDPQLPLTQVQSMEQVISDSEGPRRFNTALITSFAAAAVLLAILGIYSVIAFSVALRSQEIAIRMALGSQRVGILGMVLASGGKLALVGCLIGVVGAVGVSRLMRSFLFGVGPFDPLTLVSAALVVVLLALVAALLPGLRASSIDPTRALRAG
ncbi:MAG TPA: ABC transporter permease [Bryobacteraceae bacterium]|nr:ABC transporter permease [Bryobacteraceae bacterium]